MTKKATKQKATPNTISSIIKHMERKAKKYEECFGAMQGEFNEGYVHGIVDALVLEVTWIKNLNKRQTKSGAN